MDETSSYEEYQDLVNAIREGAEYLVNETLNKISIWHFNVLEGMKLRVENPEHLFTVYRRTSKPPEDHKTEPVVWDLEVEYQSKKVAIRQLIERLEKIWHEYRMHNEGGA